MILSNDELRKEVKLLKALKGIKYKVFAEQLAIREDSFSSWLRGKYSLGEERSQKLYEIVNKLKEEE